MAYNSLSARQLPAHDPFSMQHQVYRNTTLIKSTDLAMQRPHLTQLQIVNILKINRLARLGIQQGTPFMMARMEPDLDSIADNIPKYPIMALRLAICSPTQFLISP